MTTPPEALRIELQQQRDRGRSFRQAWPIAMSRALADLGVNEQVFWRRTWADQKAVWATSYSRAPWPANNRPALFIPEREHFQRDTVTA